MTWMITGGAGYIGSHVVRAMTAGGLPVVVVDDLSTGEADRLPADVPLVRGSTLDGPLLERVLREHDVEGVVHIAAKKQVGESVERPLWYYAQNVEGLRTVLEASAACGVRSFVFSSSAAVYGMPDVDLVTETTPCEPINPYGETKLAGEWLVSAVGRAHGMATASLRYFNVAGAAAPELSDPGVFNIVPMVFDRLTRGLAPLIFGADYPTPDGTCIRDYVHVVDLGDAHLRAMAAATAGQHRVINLGSGSGYSVREVVAAVHRVTGRPVPAREVARRPGDPAVLVASNARAAAELGWHPERDLDRMVADAWAFASR